MKRRTPTRRRKYTRPPSETVLSLDLSSVCVGFALFVDGKLRKHGKFLPDGEHGQRLAEFGTWLRTYLDKHQPHHIVFEKPYAGRRRNAYGVLMLYVGVVLRTYFEWRCDEIPDANRISPATVKRVLGVVKGETYEDRKRLMVEHINEVYGTSLTYKAKDRTKQKSDDDVADAIAVGRAWLIAHRGLSGR